MTRQKKCLLLRVCLVKSKLNQYRRCCLNYALLKKKREKNPLFIKIFRFLSGMNLTGVNGELTVWNALICLFCRNTGSILTILCLLQFDSLLWYFVWSDLIENTFLNSSSPLSITKQRGARGIPLSSKSKKRGKNLYEWNSFPPCFPPCVRICKASWTSAGALKQRVPISQPD